MMYINMISKINELPVLHKTFENNSFNTNTEKRKPEIFVEDVTADLLQTFAESECFSSEYRNPTQNSGQN